MFTGKSIRLFTFNFTHSFLSIVVITYIILYCSGMIQPDFSGHHVDSQKKRHSCRYPPAYSCCELVLQE